MFKSIQKIVWSLYVSLISISVSYAETPVFLVTPNTQVSTPLVQSQTGIAIYQVLNNTGRTLSNIQLTGLPAGVTQISNPGPDYCTSLTTLNGAGGLCLIELQINSNVIGNISGGPILSSFKRHFSQSTFFNRSISHANYPRAYFTNVCGQYF